MKTSWIISYPVHGAWNSWWLYSPCDGFHLMTKLIQNSK